MQNTSASLAEAIATASQGLIGRGTLIELVVLCAVAEEHLLVVGPPGTAKSEAVRRMARALAGKYFEYLVGRFTEPNEIFGGINLAKLKDGIIEAETSGMLPEAELVFLDEIFLGSTAILNTLLSVLNERKFRRGRTELDCPLKVCVGASNALPENPQLEAFADRFLVRVFVEPVADSQLENLLEAGWQQKSERAANGSRLIDTVSELAQRACQVSLAAIVPTLAEAIRTLRSKGIELSDRRMVRIQRLIAAATVLAGRDVASDADLWPIVFALPTRAQQDQARELLRELLAKSENAALVESALEGSLGIHARARRIERDAQLLLGDTAVVGQARRLRLEGMAREIDATFAADALPEALAPIRAQIVAQLNQAL